MRYRRPDKSRRTLRMSIAEVMERRAQFVDLYQAVREQIGRVIVGHDEIVHGVLTCLFVGGHCLLKACRGSARRCSCARWPKR